MMPRTAKPAPARNATLKPSVSAPGSAAGLPCAASIRSSVRVLAIVASTASPSAPPICCDVLMSPDARPESSGEMPLTAAIVTGTNAKPRPNAARIIGAMMCLR